MGVGVFTELIEGRDRGVSSAAKSIMGTVCWTLDAIELTVTTGTSSDEESCTWIDICLCALRRLTCSNLTLDTHSWVTLNRTLTC